ncbi:MAG: hypothetical protein WCW13_03465 [archaeon]|jgi:hypothetical protein
MVKINEVFKKSVDNFFYNLNRRDLESQIIYLEQGQRTFRYCKWLIERGLEFDCDDLSSKLVNEYSADLNKLVIKLRKEVVDENINACLAYETLFPILKKYYGLDTYYSKVPDKLIEPLKEVLYCGSTCSAEKVYLNSVAIGSNCYNSARLISYVADYYDIGYSSAELKYAIDKNLLILNRASTDSNLLNTYQHNFAQSALNLALGKACGQVSDCVDRFSSNIKDSNKEKSVQILILLSESSDYFGKSGDSENFAKVSGLYFNIFDHLGSQSIGWEISELPSNFVNSVIVVIYNFWYVHITVFLILSVLFWLRGKIRKLEIKQNLIFNEIPSATRGLSRNDFLALTATIWIGATIGHSLLFEVHAQLAQLLATRDVIALEYIVNSNMLFSTLNFAYTLQVFWLFLGIALIFGIIWFAFRQIGIEKGAQILELWWIVFFGFAFLMLVLSFGLMGLFVYIGYILLVSLLVYKVLTYPIKIDLVKSQTGTLHIPTCRFILNARNVTYVQIKDTELNNLHRCDCVKKNRENFY